MLWDEEVDCIDCESQSLGASLFLSEPLRPKLGEVKSDELAASFVEGD
jgi:hypothetical protein